MGMCQRVLEDSGSVVLSERRCTGNEQSGYPHSLLLILVSDVCSNGLDVVDTGDAGADQPRVVGPVVHLRWDFSNPASVCAPHGALLRSPIRGLCLRMDTPHVPIFSVGEVTYCINAAGLGPGVT
jgi:hypothetical protein